MRVAIKTLPSWSHFYSVSLVIALLAAAFTHAPSVNAEAALQTRLEAALEATVKEIEKPISKPITEPMIVYKSPTCGCCGAWVDHIKQAGFGSTIQHRSDLNGIKQQLGIAPRYQSCHTATLDNPSFGQYVFEGHIPAAVIQHFLANAPSNAMGLAVPGMPMGSPGMDTDRKFSPYTVLQLNKDGSSTHYATVSADHTRYMEKR